MSEKISCPRCNARIKKENISAHIKKVHPEEKRLLKRVESGKNVENLPVKLTRSQQKKIIIILVIGIVIGIILLAIASIKPPPPNDFTLYDIDGNKVTLSSYRGSVVLLDFFQTTCPYCQQETPKVLVPLHQKHDSRIIMISISIRTADTETDIRNYINKYVTAYGGSPWIFCKDTDNVASRYGVSGTPTTFILDKNGNVTLKRSGFYEDNFQRFDEKITELLQGQ